MNIYDKVHELARALKVTPEVVEYKRAFEKIKADETNMKMVEDFRKKQLEIYSIQAQGKEPSKEQMDSFRNLANIISMNSTIREFLDSSYNYYYIFHSV